MGRTTLYYRLSTMHLDIPPLRERGNDVVLLAEYFIQRISQRIHKQRPMVLSDGAKQLLTELPWRGNVQNLIDCIVQLYDEPVITVEHIRENIQWRGSERAQVNAVEAPVKRPKRKILTEEEVVNALKECDGNRSQAARLLGIDRRALYRELERLNLK